MDMKRSVFITPHGLEAICFYYTSCIVCRCRSIGGRGVYIEASSSLLFIIRSENNDAAYHNHHHHHNHHHLYT